MTDEADVVVELEKEQEAAPETEVKVEKAPEKVEPDPAIEELKRQHEELKARDKAREEARQRAEQDAQRARDEARAARQEAERAQAQVASREIDAVDAGISASKAEADAARRAYRAAMDTGDFDAAAQAQEAIAEAAARRVRLEEARADIEFRKTAIPPKQEERGDPLEAYLNQFTPPTRNWLRDHRDWVTDQRKFAKLQATHYDAVDAGHAPDTPEYFEFVEQKIGLSEKPENVVEVKAHTRQKKGVPAAPVQNTGGGTNGASGTTVTLTRSEHAAATDGTLVWNYDDPSGQKRFRKGDPIGVQEFARRKLALQASGQYDKSYTEQ